MTDESLDRHLGHIETEVGERGLAVDVKSMEILARQITAAPCERCVGLKAPRHLRSQFRGDQIHRQASEIDATFESSLDFRVADKIGQNGFQREGYPLAIGIETFQVKTAVVQVFAVDMSVKVESQSRELEFLIGGFPLGNRNLKFHRRIALYGRHVWLSQLSGQPDAKIIDDFAEFATQLGRHKAYQRIYVDQRHPEQQALNRQVTFEVDHGVDHGVDIVYAGLKIAELDAIGFLMVPDDIAPHSDAQIVERHIAELRRGVGSEVETIAGGIVAADRSVGQVEFELHAVGQRHIMDRRTSGYRETRQNNIGNRSRGGICFFGFRENIVV